MSRAGTRERLERGSVELPVALLVTDETLNPLYVNPAWSELRPEDEPAAEDAGWLTLFQPRDRERVRAWLNGVLEARRGDSIEVRGGSTDQWLEIRAAPTDDPASGLVVVALDISEQKWREGLLTFGAIHDPVTGLHNRLALLEHMELALAQMRREPSILAVLFIDLDRFKEVNDAHGHVTGDRALSMAAQRLRQALRPADTLARVGGDEFVALCPALQSAGQAYDIAHRLAASLEKPLRISDSTEVQVSATVGVAFGGRDTESPASIIDRADRAMYHTKQRGGVSSGTDTASAVGAEAVDTGAADLHEVIEDAVGRLVRLEGDLAQRWADSLSAADAEVTTRWKTACHHVGQAIAAMRGNVSAPESASRSNRK